MAGEVNYSQTLINSIKLQDIGLRNAAAKSGLTSEQLATLDGDTVRVLSITDFIARYAPRFSAGNGYALGRTDEIYKGAGGEFGLLTWQDEDFIRYNAHRIDEYLTKIIASPKPVVFFVPSENALTGADKEGKTFLTTQELQWFMNKLQNGEDIGEVFFVFGLYDVIGEEDRRKLVRRFGESDGNLRRAIRGVFSNALPTPRGIIS